MNKKILVIGTTLVLLAVGLSGCEEEFEPEFESLFEELSTTEITVLVAAYALVYGLENTSVRVRFDISKTGGDSFTQYKDLYAPDPDKPKQRQTDPTSVTYFLHEGEDIHIEIRLTGGYGEPYTNFVPYENARRCPKSPDDEDVYIWTPFMSWSFYD